jgi:hypothetical protein
VSYYFWLGIEAEQYETFDGFVLWGEKLIYPKQVEADGFITIHPKL